MSLTPKTNNESKVRSNIVVKGLFDNRYGIVDGRFYSERRKPAWAFCWWDREFRCMTKTRQLPQCFQPFVTNANSTSLKVAHFIASKNLNELDRPRPEFASSHYVTNWAESLLHGPSEMQSKSKSNSLFRVCCVWRQSAVVAPIQMSWNAVEIVLVVRTTKCEEFTTAEKCLDCNKPEVKPVDENSNPKQSGHPQSCDQSSRPGKVECKLLSEVIPDFPQRLVFEKLGPSVVQVLSGILHHQRFCGSSFHLLRFCQFLALLRKLLFNFVELMGILHSFVVQHKSIRVDFFHEEVRKPWKEDKRTSRSVAFVSLPSMAERYSGARIFRNVSDNSTMSSSTDSWARHFGALQRKKKVTCWFSSVFVRMRNHKQVKPILAIGSSSSSSLLLMSMLMRMWWVWKKREIIKRLLVLSGLTERLTNILNLEGNLGPALFRTKRNVTLSDEEQIGNTIEKIAPWLQAMR